MITVKLSKKQDSLEVYDDDGMYEETVKATLENMYDLIDKGYTFQKSPTPISILNPTSLSDAHIEAQEIWAECNMPPVRQDINPKDWEQLTEMFYDLGNAILIGDHKYVQQFVKENK